MKYTPMQIYLIADPHHTIIQAEMTRTQPQKQGQQSRIKKAFPTESSDVSRKQPKIRTAVLASAASIALLLTGCASENNKATGATTATAPQSVQTTLDEIVTAAMEGSNSTQAIAGVWLPDGTAYVRGYGEGTDANTAFRAGQQTAPLMCALALQLAREGSINLDDEISQDLTRQTGISDITYRQLCDGSSGLADFKPTLLPKVLENPARPWHENELFTEGLAHSPLPFPGQNHYLSDSDPVIMARLARVVTAENTASLLKSRIFDEVGMENSYYPDAEDTSMPGNSLSPIMYPGGIGAPDCTVEAAAIPAVSPSFLAGAGATVTTAEDLHLFYSSLFSGTFGGERLLADLNQPQSLANPERDAEGNVTKEPAALAENVIPYSEIAVGAEKIGPLYGRSSWLPGNVGATFHDPETGYTVVIALNNSSVSNNYARDTALLISASLSDAGVSVPWSAEEAQQRVAAAAICQ